MTIMVFLRKRKNKTAASLLWYSRCAEKEIWRLLRFIKIFSLTYLLSFQTTKAILSSKHTLLDLKDTIKSQILRLKFPNVASAVNLSKVMISHLRTLKIHVVSVQLKTQAFLIATPPQTKWSVWFSEWCVPALVPELLVTLSKPFFLMIKLVPMKRLELMARPRPV